MHNRSDGWRARGACGGDLEREWSSVADDEATTIGEYVRLGWCAAGEGVVAVVCQGRMGGESSCRGKRFCRAAMGGHKNMRVRWIK
jgi:hypothetical protein